MNEINGNEKNFTTIEGLAYGFLQVANEAMGCPIQNLTEMKGYDISSHILACFGGAELQRACAMAQNLGMSFAYIHQHSGILSAQSLTMADAMQEEQEPTADVYKHNIGKFPTSYQTLIVLGSQGHRTIGESGISQEPNCRGTLSQLEISGNRFDHYGPTTQCLQQSQYGCKWIDKWIDK